ncbi:hypothetical protein Tco_0583720 [Tanacetum coccineum]
MNVDQDRHMLMVDDNVGNQFRQNAMQNVGHLVGQNTVQNRGVQNVGNQNGLSVVPGIANEHGAYEEIKRVNSNSTLKDNLQQASTSSTQTDNAPVYDSDESAKVHHLKNCYDNDIFNMFTQEEQYTKLLEPIPKSQQVPQNDSNVISEVSSVEQSGETVEQHPATPEETRALYDSLNNNLTTKIEKVNSVNRKLRETNANLTTELARYKNQEKCFEINQEKYDKLERKNQLFPSFKKKGKKNDFKSRKDELLDKQIQLENKIKELDNILVKTEANESLAKHKALELEIKRLLRVVIERLQAQLGDQKGKSKDTPCVSNTLDPFSQKLENENVELEYQVRNYEKENAHLKTAYKNLFDPIKVTQTQTKAIINSLQDKLHDTIYENAKLRVQLFDMVSEQKDTTRGTSANTKFAKQSILGKPPSFSRPKLYAVTPLSKSMAFPKVGEINALLNPVTSNSVPSSRESIVVNNERVIPSSRVDNFMTNKHVKARVRTKLITVSQPHVITKNDVNSKTNGFLLKTLKALLGPEDHSLGTILRVIRVYNRRTKKIIETVNVTFDELSAMAFEQSSSKPGLQGLTSGQISSGLDLTYAPSTITTQQPTEGELDLLFEAMYDDYIGGQSSAAPKTTPAAQAPPVRQTPTTSTTIADTTPTPTLNTSQHVDELETQQQHVHQ